MIPKLKKVDYEEFLELRKGDDRLEYIDGEVYCLASPSVEHQRILLNLASDFRNFFRGKDCEPFVAPLDLLLKSENSTAPNHVQPDIMVICDKTGLKENEYIGVPSLIVEIMSPSNTSYDRIKKFNLYMRFGVREYWLINPKFKTIEVNVLTEEGMYEQVGIYKGEEIVQSVSFKGLDIDLLNIF